MRTVAIVQARMQSSRLPGKMLMDVGGRPLLSHVVGRVAQARNLDAVVVATGLHPANDPIKAWCHREGWCCYRGSDDDVLDRYYQAARWVGADVIVRITGDCPLADPALVDECVRRVLEGSAYASNLENPTFPDGCDVEACTFATLERAWLRAELQSDREHVTPWIRRNVLARWQVANDVDLSAYRLTVDTGEDLAAIGAIMQVAGPDVDWQTALRVLKEHPEIAANQHLARNASYVEQVRKERDAHG